MATVALEGQDAPKEKPSVEDLPSWAASLGADHHLRPREPGHHSNGGRGRAADCGIHVKHRVPVPDRVVEHRDEGREVDHDPCEGMQHPDGDGAFVQKND